MSEAISSPINSEIGNIQNQSQPRGSEPKWQELNASNSPSRNTLNNHLVYDSVNKKTIYTKDGRARMLLIILQKIGLASLLVIWEPK